MNNKGQTLVMFVLVLPILFIILTLVIDLGFLYIEKRNVSNNVVDAVEYYLENMEDISINSKVQELLNKNIEGIAQINIDDTHDNVKINVIKEHSGIYSVLPFNQKIDITYIGDKNSKEIIKG